MNDLKQVIVMRRDLNMRKGKMVAQGAHASMGAVLPRLGFSHHPVDVVDFGVPDSRVLEWLASSFKKICVYVNSEDELLAVYDRARDAGLISCLITDNGLTEFDGVPTNTCIAVGPDTAENIDPVTGDLKLL